MANLYQHGTLSCWHVNHYAACQNQQITEENQTKQRKGKKNNLKKIKFRLLKASIE